MKKGDLVKRNRDGRLGIISNEKLIMITWVDTNQCCFDWNYIENGEANKVINDNNFTVVHKECLLCDCKCHCNKY